MCLPIIQDDIEQYESANALEKNMQYRRAVITELFSSITTLRCFYHTAKMCPRHNSRRHKCIMNHLAWKSPNRGNMMSNKKCSYFCVGCLSPNSLMLSCEESRRQEGGETLGLECVCARGRVCVCVCGGEQRLAPRPGQLQHIFQQKSGDISSSSLLFAA